MVNVKQLFKYSMGNVLSSDRRRTKLISVVRLCIWWTLQATEVNQTATASTSTTDDPDEVVEKPPAKTARLSLFACTTSSATRFCTSREHSFCCYGCNSHCRKMVSIVFRLSEEEVWKLAQVVEHYLYITSPLLYRSCSACRLHLPQWNEFSAMVGS